MKSILFIGALVALASFYFYSSTSQATDVDALFVNFVQEYRRSYASKDEYNLRKKNFQDFLKLVEERNQYSGAEHGITQFADWSEQEFKKLLTYKPRGTGLKDDTPLDYIPKATDWTKHTTPVKDQAQCGSCWAFSAVEAVESAESVLGNKLVDLSEQKLVDCDPVSYGCDGGWMDTAVKYMIAQKTWPLETEYKYTGVDQTCKSTKGSFTLTINTYKTPSSVNSLASILQNEGAPSVAVDASDWSSYRSGVHNCRSKDLNHGVQAIGIDENGNWIIRNSWGKRWGANGFITLVGGANTCGVADEITMPQRK